MAAVTVLRRADNKAHTTSFLEADTILVGGLELSASGTAALYTDDLVTAITLGGGAQSPSIALGDSASTVTIQGDLVVNGTTTSIDTENLQTQDNHIYLNKDYTTAVGQTGGLALNYLPIAANATTSNTGGFATTTTVNTVGASGLATGGGAFVQVSGSANPANDGVYQVVSHAANLLTISGSPTHRFCNSAFTVDTGDTTAVLTNINISVIQADTTGDWQLGKADDATALTSALSTIGAGAGNSLNAAYLVGATITTTGGQGNVIVAFRSRPLVGLTWTR
jgi:hypothetical protein